jgi:hypothetical protein
MTRSKILYTLMVALPACLLVIVAGSPAIADEESVTLNGEIEVAEYDEDGNVASTAIYDSEWGFVLISNEGKGIELLAHIGALATVTGEVVKVDDDNGYSHTIIVSSYTIVEPAEPQPDPDADLHE